MAVVVRRRGWRHIRMQERQHALLVHLLTGLLERGEAGEATRKLLHVVKLGKKVKLNGEPGDDPEHPRE